MIMTHTEEASTTFASKTPTEQMNGHLMTDTESREPEQRGSSTTSPSEGRHAEETSGSSVLEMDSMDSAGNAHSSGPSCGLVSSLFPSSCRGRAEAFARRLHRRLTSLGGEDNSAQRDVDPSKLKETSWLHTSSGTKTVMNNSSNHVLQRQPRHNPETETYYDFDIDLEEDGLSSPAEEASAAELADLLVNPGVLKTNNHRDGSHRPLSGSKAIIVSSQDSEFGCVITTPITGTSPDSDSMEIYFDPESSETEKSKEEVFFDPIATSDSDAASNLSNGCSATKDKSLSCRRRPENNVEHSEDTSESSCSSRRNKFIEKDSRANDLVLSSEESSNGRSSLETTSPSHESLWSTFEESTVSLQEENPSRIGSNPSKLQNRLPKSHSDSEIPVDGTRAAILSGSEDEELDEENTDEVDFFHGPSSENGALGDATNNLAKEESLDFEENNEIELPWDDEKPQESSACSSKNLHLSGQIEERSAKNDAFFGSISVSSALECPSRAKEETNLSNEGRANGTVLNSSDEDKMCLLLKKLATSPTARDEVLTPDKETPEDDIEEEEGEEERPQKVRRCSSLKTGKTPPGTPGRKKIVRFADVLGLDLADVRTFLDEIPKIPNSAYNDLIYDDIFQKDSSPVNSLPNSWGNRYSSSNCTVTGKLDKTLVPLFQQPGGMPNFLDLVRERRVCLENALVQDPISLSIHGTVRVINLDFHKSVHIRYTLNSWKNYSDLQATYVQNSCDGFSDKFTFALYCHTLPVGQRLEFAVRFHCKGTQYWDNNAGANYCFQCLPTSSTVGYIPITATENQQREWSPMFY